MIILASIEDLHIIAITHNRSLTSLRDLNKENLGIVENIYEKGVILINWIETHWCFFRRKQFVRNTK